MGKRASGKSDQSSGFPSSVLGTVEEKKSPVDQIQGRKSRGGRRAENEREVERERELTTSRPTGDVEQRKPSHPMPGGSETSQGDSERVERALLTPRGDKLVERAMRSTSAREEEEREEFTRNIDTA